MSNARQIGTVVGSLVAAYFTAGASYAALATAAGGAVGGAIGGAIDGPTRNEGPRIEDLKVQFSTYGVGIPRISGTERVGGNVIWSTDKLEIATTTSAGKGGSVENTSYRYYVHMSLMLQETPRDGSIVSIVKFYKDGELIWDDSSGTPIESALASAENPYSSFVLFQGHQDQLPDPIEESWTGGPGTCSAYRGVVRIRMIAVECPGGRVPQFSFVTSTTATGGQEITELVNAPTSGATSGGLVTANGVWHYDANFGGFGAPDSLDIYFATTADVQRVGTMSFYSDDAYAPYPVSGTDDQPKIILPYRAGGVARLDLIDLKERTRTPLYTSLTADCPGYQRGRASYDSSVGAYVISSYEPGVDTSNPLILSETFNGPTEEITGAPALVGMYLGIAHVISVSGTQLIHSRRRASDGMSDASMPETAGPSLSGLLLTQAAMKVTASGAYALILYSSGAAGRIYKINPATVSSPGSWEVLCDDVGATTANAFSTVSTSMYATDDMAIIGVIPSTYGYNAIRFAALSLGAAKVKDIIASECELAGDGAYDVSGIPDSDTVHGYKRANPASARANIEPLLTLIGGYVVDEDNVTKFKKFADIVSVATVSFDELGQAEGDASGEAMPLNRTQEIDLPRSVTTSYINPESDYQTAAETELRQVTDATEDAQIQLPICVTADQAKKVSQMVLYDRWRRQNTRSTTVSRKFAFVSPGDGATVEYPRGTFKLWLVLATNDTGAVCEWSLCPGDASIFTHTAVGASGYTSQQVAPLAAPTRMVIGDWAQLRDADNNAGPYVAFDSWGAGSASAELLIGDDDTNLVPRGTVSASAPIGFAETVLAAAESGAVDEKNIFTVNLGGDSFAGCTRDVLLAGGGEYWAYGAPGRWEIGASALGDSLGDGRYTLSRHLRGQFGTEEHTGAHVAGDTFILLRSVGLLHPDTGVASIGASKSYRAVSKGRSQDSASSQIYANTGEGLKPRSPVNLRRTNANDLTVDRRSRMSMNNASGTLPLGEATEAYSWAFYTSGAYTTLSATVVTTAATITAAQMTAAGITPSATVYVKVRQISDTIGLGHELQASA